MTAIVTTTMTVSITAGTTASRECCRVGKGARYARRAHHSIKAGHGAALSHVESGSPGPRPYRVADARKRACGPPYATDASTNEASTSCSGRRFTAAGYFCATMALSDPIADANDGRGVAWNSGA